jgi:hypothetical protein
LQTGLSVPGFPADPDFGHPAGEDFPIGDRHTVYEWAMALADLHPYTPRLAYLCWGSGLRNRQEEMAIKADWERLKPRTANPAPANLAPSPRRSPDWESSLLKAETVLGMKARKAAVKNFSHQAWEIYCEFQTEIEAGSLRPRRQPRCIDRPDLEDDTRYVLGLDDVLPIVRRCRFTGGLIDQLLAWHAAASAAGPAATPRSNRRPETKREAFQAWFDSKHPNGAPAGTGEKALARDFTKERQIDISERTVRRALKV